MKKFYLGVVLFMVVCVGGLKLLSDYEKSLINERCLSSVQMKKLQDRKAAYLRGSHSWIKMSINKRIEDHEKHCKDLAGRYFSK